MVQVTRYSLAETAKLVRAALKDAFPGVKFSVRGKSYAGGASIDVRWTDGPTSAEVERVAKRYEGADFDGMVDLKSYITHTGPNGERVYYGADFVFCSRELSYDFLLECAETIAERYGVPAPEVKQSSHTYGGKTHTRAWYERGGTPINPQDCGSTPDWLAYKLANATSRYAAPAK